MRVAWRKRQRWWAAPVLAAAAAAVLLASCAQPAPAQAPAAKGHGAASGSVISLNTISTLKALFNRDNGRPRLVLIFSPT